MISICIPIYNVDVRPLVNDLCNQLQHGMEIVLIDDASELKFKELNKIFANKDKIQYIELPANIGRSKIRNLFLKYAKNDYLLFLDCDAKIISNDYIVNYLNAISSTTSVIFGGRIYSLFCPSKNQALRWNYGIKRESKMAEERSKNPNQSFMTNNFLIKKQLLEDNPFDERITQYGHEDTIFGLELKKKSIIIKHIQNPVLNDDVEINNVFLQKTEISLDNLHNILEFYEDKNGLINSIQLLKFNSKLKKFYLIPFVKILYLLIGKKIKKYLIHSQNPSINLFTFYKVLYFNK